ncbi:hypothetical protein V8G54_025553 [Vigna mungo]|uniref:Large ribosomal subunit protein bL12 C-terminal domain-containing protein n=1 Tax=Vigna mungo TaxID=3915 RepID=A0AAQ3RL85_VIGMU
MAHGIGIENDEGETWYDSQGLSRDGGTNSVSQSVENELAFKNKALFTPWFEVEIYPRNLPADFDPAIFDPNDHRGPPSERVFRLVDEIASLHRTGNLAGMAAKAPAAAKEEQKPEKTVFELKLESYEAACKIKIIKEVPGFTDLGLKEARNLVDKTPYIKKGVSKEEGEKIMEKLKARGAKVVM